MSETALTEKVKYELEDLLREIGDLEWERGEYTFPDFVDYFQLPQLVRIEQKWSTDFVPGQYLVLQTLFDRYTITMTSLKNPAEKYILTDWFKGDCNVISKQPVLKKRWWVFQGAFELYRFELPREIKVLAETPAHVHRIGDSENAWKKVVLKRNVILTAVRRGRYKSKLNNDNEKAMEPKEGFVLTDKKGNEYLIPPGVPFRFATRIKDSELHSEYKNNDGAFSVPEILMRYEFPLDVELTDAAKGDVIGRYRFEKFCVTKSIIACTFGSHKEPQLMEISPLTQFTLHCPECLTYGLPRENGEVNNNVDEKEVQKYDYIRSKLFDILNPAVEEFKSSIRKGTVEEIESIEKAHDISIAIEEEQSRLANAGAAYMSVDEAVEFMKNDKDVIPFSKTQPKSFTVHACIDPGNPYNEAIDYEVTDSDENKNGNSQAQIREALVMQSAPLNPIPKNSFESTLKAIPETLYLE